MWANDRPAGAGRVGAVGLVPGAIAGAIAGAICGGQGRIDDRERKAGCISEGSSAEGAKATAAQLAAVLGKAESAWGYVIAATEWSRLQPVNPDLRTHTKAIPDVSIPIVPSVSIPSRALVGTHLGVKLHMKRACCALCLGLPSPFHTKT